MTKYLSAPWVFPVSSAPLKNGVLCVDEHTGEILAVFDAQLASDLDPALIQHFDGVLVPGFVNAHCHLELSHLKEKIATHSGLPAFVNAVVALRDTFSDEEIQQAMQLADQEMLSNGIVAVGDISNRSVSASIKRDSKLYYHTFVEVFGFDRAAADIMTQAISVKEGFAGLASSFVPHAPYSVWPDLFEAIRNHTTFTDVLSIHNQETLAETELFKEGRGSFTELYERMGVALADFHGQGQSSLRYLLPQMPQNNLLLVHNTLTTTSDLLYAEEQHSFLYWCLCPSANLYIENRLPDVGLFDAAETRVVLGTDSLGSNTQLSILAEMGVLQQNFNLPFERLLKWATLNGAKALNVADRFGSFQKGKKPGIINLNLNEQFQISTSTPIQRIC